MSLESPFHLQCRLTSLRSSSGEGASSHKEKPGPRASRAPPLAEFRPRDLLSSNAAELEAFLLLENRQKEPTQKAEMLKHNVQQHMPHFPAVLRKASESLDYALALSCGK
ncbi:Melanoma-associated antigen 8 [Plecturocebus cupreus]